SILCCTRTLVPPRSTPSPYTTLFRSRLGARYLTIDPAGFRALGTARSHRAHCERRPVRQWSNLRARLARCVAGRALRRDGRGGRSEEHTSELQSRENLVCRLLLEKKN